MLQNVSQVRILNSFLYNQLLTYSEIHSFKTMNNENTFLHSRSEDILSLKKKIQTEHQKSLLHDQKINQLKTKIESAKQKIQQKTQALLQIQQKLKNQKEKSQQIPSPSEQSSQEQNSHSTNSFLPSHSAIFMQIREHFKALRMQMSLQDDEEYEDDVDVDNMTYEELLQLGEKIGKVSKGLDTKKMQSLEVKKYHNSNLKETIDCAICREQMEEGVECIELNCHHVFHEQCIKGWLNVEKHCPNCKREINFGEGEEKKNKKE